MKKTTFILTVFLVFLFFLSSAHADSSTKALMIKQRIKDLKTQRFSEPKAENGEEKNKRACKNNNSENDSIASIKAAIKEKKHTNVKIAKFESKKFKIEKPQFNKGVLKIHNQLRNTTRIQKINFIGR